MRHSSVNHWHWDVAILPNWILEDLKYWAIIHQSHIYSVAEKPISIYSFGIFQLMASVKKIIVLSTRIVSLRKRDSSKWLRKRDSSKWSSFDSFFFSINFFMLAITSYLSLQSLNLRITMLLLFMRWNACKSFSSTVMPVKDMALHICFSRFWLEIDSRTWQILIISLLTYCAILSSFTWLQRRLLQFFETCSSEWSSLYLSKKLLNCL